MPPCRTRSLERRPAWSSSSSARAPRAAASAGYGAPPRGTVLLNIAGVDTTLLPYTVDRDPDKQGRALPGCRIPIHAPSAIDSGRPDDILVLPWPIADEIQRQLVAARDRGARFAVAMPALRIL